MSDEVKAAILNGTRYRKRSSRNTRSFRFYGTTRAFERTGGTKLSSVVTPDDSATAKTDGRFHVKRCKIDASISPWLHDIDNRNSCESFCAHERA